jgi:hypothetical protein
VLGNIERAAEAWCDGDDCLAYIHLAHARLGELRHPHDAAQRLVIFDAFLKAGGSPRTIFDALKARRSYIDALEKEYNPDEPRVPAGSGKPSGEWTRDGGGQAPTLPSYLVPGAASWLGDLVPDGKVVGRIIGGNRIAIDTLAVLPDLVKQDEPRLCPASAPDVPGSDQGKPYEENRARQYEDSAGRNSRCWY